MMKIDTWDYACGIPHIFVCKAGIVRTRTTKNNAALRPDVNL
jgi:hypothetical protein